MFRSKLSDIVYAKEKVGKRGELGKDEANCRKRQLRKPSGRGNSRLFDGFLWFPLPDGVSFASRSNELDNRVRLPPKRTN